jgi:HK97 gp10 family phage protein
MKNIQIDGIENVNKRLTLFANKISDKASNEGLKSAGRAFRDKAKGNASLMVGGQMGTMLSRYMRMKVYKKTRKKPYAIAIGPAAGVSEFVHEAKGESRHKGKRTYIPTAIEYGHIKVLFGTRTMEKVAPIPFMRRAANQMKRLVRNIYTATVLSWLKRI